MAQKFYESPSGERQDDESLSGNNDWESRTRQAGSRQQRQLGEASRGANETLGNIDDVLAAEDAARQPTNAPDNADNGADGSQKLAGRSELANSESNAGQPENPMNFTGGKSGSNKSGTTSKFTGGAKGPSSALKKKIAIAGAAAGATAIGGTIVFVAMLPLKLEFVVSNITKNFSAASEAALGNETDQLFSSYVTKRILPGIASGRCHNTVSPTCVVVQNGTNPVSRLYQAWSKGHIETQLATKYGIVIGKQGKNDFTLLVNGQHFDFKKGDDIFKLGKNNVSRNEIRTTVNTALKDSTLWDKTYTRYKIGGYLEKNFGIKRCVLACDTRDKFTDSISNKKLAAEAYIFRNLAPQKYGLIMQCVVGGVGFCGTDLDPATPNDPVRETPFQKQLKLQLSAYRAAFGDEKLAALVKNAEDVSKDGLKKVVAREAIKTIAGKLGATAATSEAAGEAVEKAIGPVGWIFFIGQVVHLGSNIGPLIRYAGYAANASSAVAMYMTYNTVVSEMHSGHVDPTELGSFSDALSTNLTGSPSDQVDMTQAPYYATIMGGYSESNDSLSASIFSSLLPGVASADSTTGPYLCDSGSPPPAGSPVCPEENFTTGNHSADVISDFINSIPGLSLVGDFVTTLGNFVSKPISWIIDIVPGLSQIVSWITSGLSSLMNLIEKSLISSPFSDNMSGARTFDMLAAGGDVAGNSSCQELMGCSQISDQQVGEIRNQQINDEKATFDAKPIFARLFDTSSAYSLISRLAMDMPTNMLSATNNSVASLLTDPLSKIANMFSSVFSTNHAFAATTAQADPFGIVQYGYTSQQMADIGDPETYWSQNCADPNNPDQLDQAKYVTWLNSQQQNTNTGEAMATTPNPCLLIQSAVQSAGVMFDTSLMPAGS